MTENNKVWYEGADVLSRAINTEELAALQSMFDGPGWKVFMDLKAREAKTSNMIAMGLSTPDEVCIGHKALYHGLMDLLTFEPRLQEAIDAEDAKELKDIESAPDGPDTGMPSPGDWIESQREKGQE